MTNVLPPQTQRVLWQSYMARMSIVLSLSAIVLAGVGALAILPARITLSIADRALAPQSSSAHEKVSIAADREAIAATQGLLEQATPFMATTTSMVDTISSVLALRPKGILVNHITYVLGKNDTITISGSATRDQINAFKSAVSADKRFSTVHVPVETLVGSQDRTFTMTITGNF